MTKSILLSIQPKWVEKILNGKKTIEVRKVKPKLKTPYEVLMYCTKEKPYIVASYSGVVENEKPYYVDVKFMPPVISEFINGKVVAKFTLNKVEEIPFDYDEHIRIYDKCCIDMEELISYSKSKTLYAWHIDNLVIFDKPKELNEFKKWTTKTIYSGLDCPPYTDDVLITVTKAPQSFMYVEVKE